MRKRGFTLVEVAMVLCLMTVISTAILWLLRSKFRHDAQLVQQSDQLEESRRVAWRIFSLSREGSEILPDQRGIRLGRHGLLVWRSGLLTFQGRPLLSEKLRDFAVVRRDNRLQVLFQFEQGRYQFEQPRPEQL